MPVTLELGRFCNGADHSWDIRLKLNTRSEPLAAVIVLDTYSKVAFDLDSKSMDSESDNETGHARYGMNIAKTWQRFSHDGAQEVDCVAFFVVYYGFTVSVSFLLICRTEYRC